MGDSISSYPVDVHAAARAVAESFGIKRLAGLLEMPLSTLYAKTDALSADPSCKLTVWDVVKITVFTRDTRIVEAISRTVGGAHYQLPDLSEVPDDALRDLLLKADEERGEFAGHLRRALADKHITQVEWKQLDADLLEIVAVYAEARARIAAMAGQ